MAYVNDAELADFHRQLGEMRAAVGMPADGAATTAQLEQVRRENQQTLNRVAQMENFAHNSVNNARAGAAITAASTLVDNSPRLGYIDEFQKRGIVNAVIQELSTHPEHPAAVEAGRGNFTGAFAKLIDDACQLAANEIEAGLPDNSKGRDPLLGDGWDELELARAVSRAHRKPLGGKSKWER